METITADHSLRQSATKHRLEMPAFEAFALARIRDAETGLRGFTVDR